MAQPATAAAATAAAAAAAQTPIRASRPHAVRRRHTTWLQNSACDTEVPSAVICDTAGVSDSESDTESTPAADAALIEACDGRGAMPLVPARTVVGKPFYCYMMVTVPRPSPAQISGAPATPARSTRASAPERAQLKIAQWPPRDVAVYTLFSVSRRAAGGSPSRSRNAARRGSEAQGHHHGATPTVGGGRELEVHGAAQAFMGCRRTRTRRSVHSPKYRLAMIVACGTYEMAVNFHRAWSFRTRGPIPRASSGLVLARHFDYQVWIDSAAILNSSRRLRHYRLDISERGIRLVRRESASARTAVVVVAGAAESQREAQSPLRAETAKRRRDSPDSDARRVQRARVT